jgi:hypothetical protein
MHGLMRLMMAGGIAMNCIGAATAQSEGTAKKTAINSTSAVDGLPSLPPLPSGKSTVLGGEIRSIDPVLDQLTLQIFGQKPVKVLFDGRTELFVDGKKTPLRALQSGMHASIQTRLDGPSVFALSIRVLSQAAPGEYQGQVISYDPETGELAVGGDPGHSLLTLTISRDTVFVREGQRRFSSAPTGPADLQKGTLVSIQFGSDSRGHGVANRIAILATPGAEFAFDGNLASLDMNSGRLVLANSRDNRSYLVFFDASSPQIAQGLHIGQHVRMTVEYDGTRYQARDITPY